MAMAFQFRSNSEKHGKLNTYDEVIHQDGHVFVFVNKWRNDKGYVGLYRCECGCGQEREWQMSIDWGRDQTGKANEVVESKKDPDRLNKIVRAMKTGQFKTWKEIKRKFSLGDRNRFTKTEYDIVKSFWKRGLQ